MYLSDHSKNLISAEEKVAELIKQRDELRAELATERARLDWLESHAMAQHSPYISIAELGVHYNGFPGSLRGSIDTAMKKDAK